MKKLTVTVCCLLLVAVACLIYRQFMLAEVVARESAQRTLFVEAKSLLREYFDGSGKYPEKLTELRFTYPDGGDKSTLEDFEYSLNNSGYRLRMVGYHSQQSFEFGAETQHER